MEKMLPRKRLSFQVAVVLTAGCSTSPQPDFTNTEDAHARREAPRTARAATKPAPKRAPVSYPIDLIDVLRLAGANNLTIAYFTERIREAKA